MNKIGQPPWSALQFPSAAHGASTAAGLAPATAQVHPGLPAGRGPGPWLTLASVQDGPNHRRTETGLAGHRVVAPVRIVITFTEARCSGLVFSHAHIGIWAGLGCCGPVSASMDFFLLPRRQVAAALPPPRRQGPARDAPDFRLKYPHTPIVPRAEWEIKNK